jgi:hypothetical protein
MHPTQSAITQPVMTLQHLYSTQGTYTITLSVTWTGQTATMPVSGTGTKSDTVSVPGTCGGPVITSQPANEVVLAGGTAQFTVGASSFLPMYYQWYFNKTNPVVSPPTFATLTMQNITVNAAGSYSVVITNAYGSTNSAAATLTVVPPLVTGLIRNADGSVTLDFQGLANTESRIWAATNLTPPILWLPIFTNTTSAPDGTWQFTDPNAINSPERFYHFSVP